MAGQRSIVREEHFRLLREFNRSPVAAGLGKKQREEFWAMACRAAGQAVLPRETVLEEWKKFIAGEAEHSSLAANGDVDPNWVTIGITWDKKLVASHTLKTHAILGKILEIWARAFQSREDFEAAVLDVVGKVSSKRWK